MKWDCKSIREKEDSTAACASLWCLLKQKHFNFLKQSLPSCVSSTSLSLWGQVSFYQDSGTWAEGLFGERAQLIDFLSSPLLLLWENYYGFWKILARALLCHGSMRKSEHNNRLCLKNPGLQILQKCNFTSSSMPAPVHFAATMSPRFSLI